MLIFLIVVAIIVVCFILDYKYDLLPLWIAKIFLLFPLGAMIFHTCAIHINDTAYYEANKQIYNNIVYQLENGMYNNDNEVGKYELYQQVQDWNSDLAKGKAMQHNIWVGMFYFNFFDDFDFINLEDYN